MELQITNNRAANNGILKIQEADNNSVVWDLCFTLREAFVSKGYFL